MVEEIYNYVKKNREAFRQKMLDMILDDEQRVVDLGCGVGDMMELLLANGKTVYGVDVRQDKVDLCVENGLDVVQFDLTSVEDYQNKLQGEYDLGVSFDVLEHFSDPLSVLKLWNTETNINELLLCISAGPEACHDEYERHLFIYNRQSLDEHLEQSGWEAVGEVEEYRPVTPEQPPAYILRCKRV